MESMQKIETKTPNPMSVDKKTLDRMSLQQRLSGRPIGEWSQQDKDAVLEWLAKKYDLIPDPSGVK